MGIRLSSNQFVYNYKISLNEAYGKQQKLMEQGDGSKIHRPSDNAVDYTKLLRYNISDNENNQYQTNVQTALSWMQMADATAVQMTEIQKTFKEKTTAAANDTNNETDMAAIGKEMMAEIQELVSLGNTQQVDRYIFSGQSDLIQPFRLQPDLVDRGLAKTLDDKQAEFFSNVDDSGSVRQMLTLEGSDGKTYYLDTVNGYVYTQDFVENEYKDRIAAGQTTVLPDEDVACKQENELYSHVGKSLSDSGITPSADFLAALGATEDDFVVVKDGSGTEYVGDKNTGKVYSTDFVQNFSGTAIKDSDSVGTYPSSDFLMVAKVSGNSSDYANYNAASEDFIDALTLRRLTDTSTNPATQYVAFDGVLYDYNAAMGGTVTPVGTYTRDPSSGDYQDGSGTVITDMGALNLSTNCPALYNVSTPEPITAIVDKKVLQDNGGTTYFAVQYNDVNGNPQTRIYNSSNGASGFTGVNITSIAIDDAKSSTIVAFAPDPVNTGTHTTTDAYRQVEAGLYVVEYKDANGVTQTGYADPGTGMIKSSAFKTTPSDLATYQSSGGATGTWLGSDVNWLDPTVIGDLYATNEKYSFVGAYELQTDNAKNYFGEDIFIQVKDDKGTDFYYSPTTRKVYTQQLMDDVDSGAVTGKVKDSDAVDDMRAMYVAKNFASTGEIKEDDLYGTGWSSQFIGSDGTVVEMTLKTIAQPIVHYTGDDKYISMVKLNGQVDPSSDTVNMTGQDLFGADIFDDPNSGNRCSGTAMLNNMLTVCQQTLADNQEWLSSDGMTLSDAAHAVTVKAETKMGARAQLYESVANVLTKQGELITGDITQVSSTDVAELAMNLMEQQTLYNLALSLGARVIPQSLADYL